jgi:hypothetical protein
MPIDETQQPAESAPQQGDVTQRRKRRTMQRDNDNSEQQAVTHDDSNRHGDDESIITDAELNEPPAQIQSQLTPAVNLNSQRDDPFF